MTPSNPKEREEKCLCEKKNAGFCKHCFEKNLTQPSVPAEKLNYERDYSHIHCWDQSNKLTIAACGKLRKEHKQCCLCEKLPPEEAKEGWEEKFDSYKFIEGGAPNKTKSKLIKAFISDLLSKAKTEERIVVAAEIRKQMAEFANTSIEKRGTGWDWLLKLRDIIHKK